MITLSSYLNYIYDEILKARRMADESSVRVAKEYAEDRYLRHFKAPRFTMPVIKLNLPVRIDDVDQRYHYELRGSEQDLVDSINDRLRTLTDEYGIPEIEFDIDMLRAGGLQPRIEQREESDPEPFTSTLSRGFLQQRKRQKSGWLMGSAKEASPRQESQMQSVIEETIGEHYRKVVTDIALQVSPETSGVPQEDVDKLLLHLNIELVEGGLKIREITDEDDNTIDLITID